MMKMQMEALSRALSRGGPQQLGAVPGGFPGAAPAHAMPPPFSTDAMMDPLQRLQIEIIMVGSAFVCAFFALFEVCVRVMNE